MTISRSDKDTLICDCPGCHSAISIPGVTDPWKLRQAVASNATSWNIQSYTHVQAQGPVMMFRDYCSLACQNVACDHALPGTSPDTVSVRTIPRFR